MRALPLTKLRVGHILVDRTLLKFLLQELQKAGEPISDLEIPLLTPAVTNVDENGEPLQKRAGADFSFKIPCSEVSEKNGSELSPEKTDTRIF